MIKPMNCMKTSRLYLIFLVFLVTALLSACVGVGPANSSWPGMTVDAVNDVVYVANNPHVHKINIKSGAELDKYPETAQKNVVFFAQPALTTDGQLMVGSYDKLLYSLDSQTLDQKWTSNLAGKRYIAGPLVINTNIFAPNEDNSLYVLDQNGTLLWKYATDNSLWATPTTDGKNIYLASMDHKVYAIDALSGNLVWKTDDLGGTLTGGPTLGPNGVLYVGTFGSEMLALNAKDGRILWRTPTLGWVWSAPALDGDKLYFGDLSSTIYALSAANGKILWQKQPDVSDKRVITGTPLVQDGVVYVGTESGSFYALNASDGSQLWTKVYQGKIYTGPQAAGDLILVALTGSRGSFLFALTKDGAEKWAFPPPQPSK